MCLIINHNSNKIRQVRGEGGGWGEGSWGEGGGN